MRRILIIPALMAAALLYAVADRESGLLTWLELSDDLVQTRAWNEDLRREIEERRAEARGLENDSEAIERAIREDLGLGRPGETVVILRPDDPR